MDIHIRSLGMASADRRHVDLGLVSRRGIGRRILDRIDPPTTGDRYPDADAAAGSSPTCVAGAWETQLRNLEITFSDGDLLDRAAALGREWFAEITEESA